MVASFSPWQAPPQRQADGLAGLMSQARTQRDLPGGQQRGSAPAPLTLIHGSLSAHTVARQAPWLAGLHRLADGTLAGLGLCMLGLSALTLHWQNHWGQSFESLESAQVLEHRMQESVALLEQHHLASMGQPGRLVPTSSHQLIHLPTPKAAQAPSFPSLLRPFRLNNLPAGY